MGTAKTDELIRLKKTFERQLQIFDDKQDQARLYPKGRPVFQRKTIRYRHWEENKQHGNDQQPQVVTADRRLINHQMVKDFKSSVRYVYI